MQRARNKAISHSPLMQSSVLMGAPILDRKVFTASMANQNAYPFVNHHFSRLGRESGHL
jgi:hypothetical protein